jgi:hypothetical protein
VTHLHHKVSALIDGELQGGARRRALAHARSCEVCQHELEQTYALKQRLLGLAAAEPPADLFALLGSVRSNQLPRPETSSRVGVVTRRVLVGAGSMSLAVVTLAYAVGGSEQTATAISPPVQEFSAEFAGSTGLAPLADPAVEALAAGRAPTGQGSPVGGALTQKVGAGIVPPTSGDETLAVHWLHRAASAPARVAYSGVRDVAWYGSTGESTVTLDVAHAPRQGTSYSVTSDPTSPSATFIARSEVSSSGGLGGEPVDLLIASYDVSIAGSDVVDGRRATVVAAGRDGVAAARFWIDDETGLLLRREMYDDGQLVRVSSLSDLKTSGRGFMSHLPPELEAPTADDLSTRYARTLNDEGWACPDDLPGEFRLTLLHRLQSGHRTVVHAAYSDGLSIVSVFEEHGELDTSALGSFHEVTSGDSTLWVQEGLPTVAVWESDGMVYTVLTDAPASTTAELVAALPHDTTSQAGGNRLGRGLTRIGSYLTPGG